MPGLPLNSADDTVKLAVVANQSEHNVIFELRKNTLLVRLIDAFHAHRRQPAGTYILFYNSQEVNVADTPESLRMLVLDYLQAVPNPALSSFFDGRRRLFSNSYYVTVRFRRKLQCQQLLANKALDD